MAHLREITIVQTATILISTIIGVGVLRLPLLAVRIADTGAPFVTFLAVIVFFIGLWVITKLGIRFPNQSIIEYSEDILGKWLGRMYGLAIIAFFLILTGFALREFGAVVVTAVLKESPLEVTVLAMLLLTAIFTRDNLNTFAYIHNFYVPIILIPGLVIVAVSLKNANSLYLQPLFGNEPSGMFSGVITSSFVSNCFYFDNYYSSYEKARKSDESSCLGNHHIRSLIYNDCNSNACCLRARRNEKNHVTHPRTCKSHFLAWKPITTLGCCFFSNLGNCCFHDNFF